MNSEIKVPAMGESISEATVGVFLKPNGSFAKADEELVELETDKVNQVLYAQQSGTVFWTVAVGDTVKIGQVIGSIAPGKESEVKAVSQKKEAELARKPGVKTEPVKANEKMDPSNTQPTLTPPQPSSGGARFTRDQFLSVLKKDQQATIKPRQEAGGPSSTPQQSRGETRKKMSKVRKVIGERLVNVLQQSAMLTTFNEVDMTKVLELRESYKEGFTRKYGVRLGFMPFFVKAAVSAMKAFPEINSYIDGDEIVYREYYDIGIAVGTDKGLFVPVVRDCDRLSFAEIEQSIEGYAGKAREGGLVPGDMQGGGFTITNGGVYGSLLSTPIINPPQCAILGMHKIMKRAVVIDDQVAVRQMMYLALSYDHRVVDGKGAVSFLVHIKNTLEDPSRLLIGV